MHLEPIRTERTRRENTTRELGREINMLDVKFCTLKFFEAPINTQKYLCHPKGSHLVAEASLKP